MDLYNGFTIRICILCCYGQHLDSRRSCAWNQY